MGPGRGFMEKGLFEVNLKAVLLKLLVVKEQGVLKKFSNLSLTNTFIKKQQNELLEK